MQSVFLFLLMLNILIFAHLKHPLAMGMTLLFQSLFVCLFTGFLRKRFWFSYILFLVFLGGLLVLFAYVSALASNEKFEIKINRYTLIKFLIIIFQILIIKILIDDVYLIELNSTVSDESRFLMDGFYDFFTDLSSLYNYPSCILTIVIILYLLFTLIVSVKITNFSFGPLRKIG